MLSEVEQQNRELDRLRSSVHREANSRLLAEEALDETRDRLQMAVDAAGLAYLLRRRLPGRIHGRGVADRLAAAQVRQREVGGAVAAVLGAQQREQRLVLVDRQQLAVAQRPEPRREVEAGHHDLADEELTHCPFPLDACACRPLAGDRDMPPGAHFAVLAAPAQVPGCNARKRDLRLWRRRRAWANLAALARRSR